MDLTEEQLAEAKKQLALRERERARAYQAEYYRRQAEAEERFWTGMLAKYPGIPQETMYDIYSECRDYFD